MADTSNNLFEDAPTGFAAGGPVSARECRVNTDVLERLLARPAAGDTPTTVTLNLVEDVTVMLSTTHIVAVGADGFNWSGKMPRVPSIQAHLTVIDVRHGEFDGCRLAGLVIVDGKTYQIHATGPGHVRIARVISRPTSTDCALHPSRSGLVQEQEDGTESDQVKRVQSSSQAPPKRDGQQDLAIIDVLVIYPSSEESTLGGHRNIRLAMENAALLTNAAFETSRIPAEVHLVGFKAVELSAKGVSDAVWEWKRSEALRTSVGALRDQLQADIVVLVVPPEDDDDTVYGQASLTPQPPGPGTAGIKDAFLAIALRSGFNGFEYPLALAHELGHLLGAHHDRITDPYRLDGHNPMYDHVRGYANLEKRFVTVMGYPWSVGSDGVAVTAYSTADPDILWEGNALGIARNLPNAADASDLLRRSVYAVADYRGARSDDKERYTLSVEVEPELGGTALPDHFGPYVAGTIVSVTATPRTGYRFMHWTLGGQRYSDLSTTSIEIQDSARMVAVFDAGEARCEVVCEVEPPGAATVSLWPPGERFVSGSIIQVRIDVANRQKYKLIRLLKDGEDLHIYQSSLFIETIQVENKHTVLKVICVEK
jgi:hypothetical protein